MKASEIYALKDSGVAGSTIIASQSGKSCFSECAQTAWGFWAGAENAVATKDSACEMKGFIGCDVRWFAFLEVSGGIPHRISFGDLPPRLIYLATPSKVWYFGKNRMAMPQCFTRSDSSPEDTDNIVLGDVAELAEMKLRGHPLAAARCAARSHGVVSRRETCTAKSCKVNAYRVVNQPVTTYLYVSSFRCFVRTFLQQAAISVFSWRKCYLWRCVKSLNRTFSLVSFVSGNTLPSIWSIRYHRKINQMTLLSPPGRSCRIELRHILDFSLVKRSNTWCNWCWSW